MKKSIIILSMVALFSISQNKVFAETENTCNNNQNLYEVIYDELENKPILEKEVVFQSKNKDSINSLYSASNIMNTYEATELRSASYDYDLNNYFNSVEWINRDGVQSLSMDPKNNVRMSSPNLYTARMAWYTISRNFSNDWRQDNTDSMKRQFDCHVALAKYKSRWNIEPSKKYTNPFTCN